MTGCCANRGAWYQDTVSFSATLTTITISTATGNVAVGYILVGMQQWGYLARASSGTSGTTIDLPYPVTYAIGVISTSVGSGADITTSISINPADQTLAVARRPTSGNVAWFIIGY